MSDTKQQQPEIASLVGNYDAVREALANQGRLGFWTECAIDAFSSPVLLDALCRFRCLPTVGELQAENERLRGELETAREKERVASAGWEAHGKTIEELRKKLAEAEQDRDSAKEELGRLYDDICKERRSLHRQLDEAGVPDVTPFLDDRLRLALDPPPGLSVSDYVQFRQWLSASDRKPAAVAFTAGLLRDVASAVEESGVLEKPKLPPGHDWDGAKSWWSIDSDEFDLAALALLAHFDPPAQEPPSDAPAASPEPGSGENDQAAPPTCSPALMAAALDIIRREHPLQWTLRHARLTPDDLAGIMRALEFAERVYREALERESNRAAVRAESGSEA